MTDRHYFIHACFAETCTRVKDFPSGRTGSLIIILIRPTVKDFPTGKLVIQAPQSVVCSGCAVCVCVWKSLSGGQ